MSAGDGGALVPPAVPTPTRPRGRADTFIQKTRKLYADSRAPRNVGKLAADLAEVRGILTRSVADVLGAGERLDAVSAASAQLRSESARYAAKAKALSRQARGRPGGAGRGRARAAGGWRR